MTRAKLVGWKRRVTIDRKHANQHCTLQHVRFINAQKRFIFHRGQTANQYRHQTLGTGWNIMAPLNFPNENMNLSTTGKVCTSFTQVNGGERCRDSSLLCLVCKGQKGWRWSCEDDLVENATYYFQSFPREAAVKNGEGKKTTRDFQARVWKWEAKFMSTFGYPENYSANVHWQRSCVWMKVCLRVSHWDRRKEKRVAAFINNTMPQTGRCMQIYALTCVHQTNL